MTLRFALIAVLALIALPAHAASVDEVPVHWTSHGAGPAIILVHGQVADESAWSEQVPALSRNYRVITLDLPGYGLSGMPASFSIELFARAVEAVRANAQVTRVVLVGHDVGAMVIRTYAVMYPARVAGLVIVDGAIPFADGRPGPPADFFTDTPARREQAIRDLLGEWASPQLQERIRKMMLTPPSTTVTGTLRALWDMLLDRSQNEQVTLPVLAVYSGLHPTESLARGSLVKRFFPMAEYYWIPGTGHFVMMEAPAAVNRLIEGFLAGIAF